MESNAWLAGFFDGEGSIGIYPRSFNISKTIRYYVLVVSLAQSGDIGKFLLEQCKAKYGGSVYQNKSNGALQEVKTMWKWNVSAEKAKAFLLDIEPHTIVKLDQLYTALEFQELNNKRFDCEEATKLAQQIKAQKDC